MGRLAHRIHAKSAPQAYRAGDKERCGLLCCVAQSLVPGMYRQRLPLIRTPWHQLSSYQHLSKHQQLSKPGLWQVSPSLQLIRTPWHHLISYQSLVFGMYRQACSSYTLLGTPRQLPKPGSWHVSPAPAAHAHSLAPLISYLLVSHRRSSNCFETVVLWTCRF